MAGFFTPTEKNINKGIDIKNNAANITPYLLHFAATTRRVEMNQMLCGYRDDERLWDAADTASAMSDVAIEQHTDYLLDECKEADYCADLVNEYDLHDGDFLPSLMTEIANWTGRSDDANDRMRKLHVLLANELRKIAVSEVGA